MEIAQILTYRSSLWLICIISGRKGVILSDRSACHTPGTWFRFNWIESTRMSKHKSDVLVCKSNELIEARYHLTAVAQKIAACTISRVNPTDHANPLPSFKWSISELSEISGISQQVLRNKLADYTRELKSVVVELRRTDSNSYQQLSPFRVFTYDDAEKQLEIVFEEKLAEYIRDFSRNFTQYQLIQIQKLVSSHSVRIFDILPPFKERDSR